MERSGTVANRDHLEILTNGALEWNTWRRGHPRVRPDLRQAHLVEANLRGCNLRGVDFRGASLLAANVERADLRGADLSECDLRFCEWRGARLNGAKLREATGADSKMLAAAARPDWRAALPPPRAMQTGAALAALALAWAFAEGGWPESADEENPPPPGIELAAAMSEPGLTGWAIEGVAISGGLMRLRLNTDEMTEQAYLATLAAACRALDRRALAPAVERIEVLSRGGDAGWVFEQAARCRDVLDATPERLAVTVAASSRPVRPKPSPGATR